MSDLKFLTENLLAEHSRAQATMIAKWIGHDAERFAALMKIFLEADYRLQQRSAWVLSFVAERSPHLVENWLPLMIPRLRNAGHEAVRRNIYRLLQNIEIPEELLGHVADSCFQTISNPAEPSAIRAFAIAVLERICEKVPELKEEFHLILEENLEQEPPAFRSRARKILQKRGRI